MSNILRIAVVVVLLLLLVEIGSAATLTVNASGGAMYTKIQDAVNAASPSDTILVHNGIYNERIIVNKQLILQGVGQPMVNAGGNGSAINLSAGFSTLEGFVTTGSGNNWSYDLINGMLWYDAGIFVDSNNNIIRNNIATNNPNGIILNNSINNSLEGNEINSNNTGGTFNVGIYLYHSGYNRVSDNNVDIAVSNAGIELWSSNNNNLSGNIVNAHRGHGILLMGQNGGGSNYNTLSRNTVFNNTDGIFLWGGSNNELIGNCAKKNIRGVRLDNSGNNLIYLNTFEDSGIYNAYGYQSTAQWDNGTIGNHYSNFDEPSEGCIDTDNNGLCDSNYNIPFGAGTDRYPLVSWNGIKGTVLNNGTGIAGVIVTTNTSYSTTTNSSGFYSLPVPTGTYNLTVTKEPEYYSNSSVTVEAISGTTVTQDIELIKKPTGNITGSVTSV